MRYLSSFVAASLGLAVSGAASAADLRPIQSQPIDLGAVAGDAYYTVEPDGFHVVATFAPRDGSGSPVRVQAVLASGQAVSFSTPRGAGEAPVLVSFRRQDSGLVVSKAALTN